MKSSSVVALSIKTDVEDIALAYPLKTTISQKELRSDLDGSSSASSRSGWDTSASTG
jgi:hypothetical protein